MQYAIGNTQYAIGHMQYAIGHTLWSIGALWGPLGALECGEGPKMCLMVIFLIFCFSFVLERKVLCERLGARVTAKNKIYTTDCITYTMLPTACFLFNMCVCYLSSIDPSVLRNECCMCM